MNESLKFPYASTVFAVALINCVALFLSATPCRSQELALPKSREIYMQPDHKRTVLQQRDLLYKMILPQDPARSILLVRVSNIVKAPLRSLAAERRLIPPEAFAKLQAELKDMQQVWSGQFQIIEPLRGAAPIQRIMIQNTDEELHPRPALASLPRVATTTLRLGEYWIALYDHRTHEMDRRNSFWLSGPNDPILQAYRRHRSWMLAPDTSTVLAGLRAVLLDTNAQVLDRLCALYSLRAFPRWASSNRVEIQRRLDAQQRAVADLFSSGSLPRELRTAAIGATTINLTQELSPDSPDVIQLHYLLETVTSSDDSEIVGDAATRLYIVLIEQEVGGPYAIHWCPQILQALEQREEMDHARHYNGAAAGTLNNLKLVGRRHLSDIERDLPNTHARLIVRQLPPIRDRALARRIQSSAAQ